MLTAIAPAALHYPDPLPVDRCAWVCYAGGQGLPLCPSTPTREFFRATLREVSTRAASLHMSRPFWPGTTLVLDLGGCQRTVPARVRAARPDAPPGAGGWVVVCEFNRSLTDEELRTLRVHPPATPG